MWFFGDVVVGVGRRENDFNANEFYLEEQIDEAELLQTA